MKIAYFDPVGGASGDMTLGALVDAGAPFEELRAGLGRLPVSGFTVERSRSERMGICGTHVEVKLEGGPQPHRHLHHIEKILDGAELPERVQERARATFRALAGAEAKVHGTTVEKVHFHEVGAVDAIVDVVGAALGVELLGVDEVRFGRLPLGRGFTRSAHGRIPLPAPATLELLKDQPVEMVETLGETVTPTGAALLTSLGRCAPLPAGAVVRAVGYGVGTLEFPDRPNVLRLVLADSGEGVLQGEVSVLTAAIDDMSAESFGFLLERLLAAGALDAYFAPVTMKKSRPGAEVTALAPPALEEQVALELLRHSTSLGLRVRREARRELPREVLTVETEFGPVRVKVARLGDAERIAPEFEDCAELARRLGRPLADIFEAARRAARGR